MVLSRELNPHRFYRPDRQLTRDVYQIVDFSIQLPPHSIQRDQDRSSAALNLIHAELRVMDVTAQEDQVMPAVCHRAVCVTDRSVILRVEKSTEIDLQFRLIRVVSFSIRAWCVCFPSWNKLLFLFRLRQASRSGCNDMTLKPISGEIPGFRQLTSCKAVQ